MARLVAQHVPLSASCTRSSAGFYRLETWTAPAPTSIPASRFRVRTSRRRRRKHLSRFCDSQASRRISRAELDSVERTNGGELVTFAKRRDANGAVKAFEPVSDEFIPFFFCRWEVTKGLCNNNFYNFRCLCAMEKLHSVEFVAIATYATHHIRHIRPNVYTRIPPACPADR